ncbi:hypothetical protein I316_04396 [Kwoniella heveanensis BCC8398]|uniref:SWI5-dependent HO expression protein 3 n=1 Tax=Kwoniella heveanensis BCC8398 TaxID=1296120 RepID=A0A1B9GSK2_9TREE|nr:hypothetical protein I316_04396 [Kwoniella heveanensis BCC8398]
MADTTPSKIPIAINKRSSLSSSSLMQLSSSSTSLSNLPHSRSQSPLNAGGSQSGSAPSVNASAKNGRASPAGQQRRWSLLSGGGGPSSRKTSFSEGVGMTRSGSGGGINSDDPGQIKAHIVSLQHALQAAQQRLIDVQNGNTSSLPLTPVDGLVSLPEVEVDTYLGDRLMEESDEHGRDSPLDPEPPTSANSLDGSRLGKGLPHSNPSFDLRSRAVTPSRPVNTKVDGRSRIPQAVVAGSAALHPTPPPNSSSRPHASPPSPVNLHDNRNLRSPFLAPESPQPPSPYSGSQGLGGVADGRLSPSPALSPGLRRASGPGGGSAASTRVIDGLQTELVNTRGHLERVKQEVRSCQRVIGSLTRQTEDLKETRERMRMECEGLNNVVSRKERLLQEILERARTAEAALASHQSTRKALEQSTKKSLSHMTAQLTEAQAGQAKAERESAYTDSVRSLRDVWAREVKSVREEWKKGEEKGKREREEARQKHLALVKLVQSQSADRAAIQDLAEKASKQSALATEAFEAQITGLRAEIDRSSEESRLAKAQTEELAGELVRLRRLMREPRRESLEEAAVISSNDIASFAINDNGHDAPSSEATRTNVVEIAAETA